MITYQLCTTSAKNARISLKYAQKFFIKMYVCSMYIKYVFFFVQKLDYF